MGSTPHVLGVVGGSGLYRIPELDVLEELTVETPFGPPSSPIVKGRLGEVTVYFLARHGLCHTCPPGLVPYRANLYALKSLGVSCVLSVSAVGSLREEIAPGHLVVPDQLIDRTMGRPQSFFGKGLVVHVAMAEPYCRAFSKVVFDAACEVHGHVHPRATLVCIDGPAFSTRAESFLYRSWNADLVGMTALPEAKLAREASVCYACLALATDYDCWHPHHDAVTVESVLEVMKANNAAARAVIMRLVQQLDGKAACGCAGSLKSAVVTDPSALDPQAVAALRVLTAGQVEPGQACGA